MGKIFLRVIGSMIASYIGIGLVLVIFAVLGILHDIQTNYTVEMLANLVLACVVVGFIFIYSQKMGGVPFRAFSFSWNKRDLGFSFLTVFITLLVSCFFMLLLNNLGNLSITVLRPDWLPILVGFVGECGAFHEEVLSRGYILTILQKRFGIALAILISATCFTLMHFVMKGISYMAISWFLAGLLYGYIYVKSGSLWVSLCVHAAHNYATDLFMYSENGVSIFKFINPVNDIQKIVFESNLTILLFGITYIIYGRNNGFLEPNARLVQKWSYVNVNRKILDTDEIVHQN